MTEKTETTPDKQPSARPMRPERLARLMRWLNIPMRVLLGLPFPTPLSDRLMLLTYEGRKTGRPYRIPVSYVREDDVMLTPGGGRWTSNLRDGGPITVRLRGRDVSLIPELVRTPKDVDALLHRMLERNSRLATFVPFIEPDGAIEPAKLETALQYGFCVVRWHQHHAGLE